FTDASFTGRDLHATWLWQLGDRLQGRLGHTETTALASFAFIQARTPDVLDTRTTFWDANYGLAPRWRVQAGLSRLEQSNRDPAYRSSDIEITGGESTLSYVSRANNSLGLRVHAEDGRFPNLESVGTSLVDYAYRQAGADLVADWTLSGASHLGARIGQVSRRYAELPQRDFSGAIARAEYDWKPTGKLSLRAIVQRDISAYEDVRSNFVLVKGVTLRPSLRLSDKTELGASLESSVLDYLGDPGLAAAATPGRVDRVHAAGLSLSYRPTRAATLQLSLRRERRSSNVPLADYEAATAFASVRIAF
ncbi:MAG: outer membrane beta-barrel protein, partial [Stellaceae bacterium]